MENFISYPAREKSSCNSSVQEKLMTSHEAAEYLSLSLSHLYSLTCKKKIPFHKPNGKLIFFYKSELDRWVTQGLK